MSNLNETKKFNEKDKPIKKTIFYNFWCKIVEVRQNKPLTCTYTYNANILACTWTNVHAYMHTYEYQTFTKLTNICYK